MILVTGGTGLVGSYLLYELTCKGHKVRALLRPGKKSYDIRNLFKCLSAENTNLIDKVEWFEGDVLDPFSLQQAMQGVDYVYHCAAFISFNPRELKEMLAVNVDGTSNVVNACLENSVKKLCHVSSVAALGHTDDNSPVNEDTVWIPSKHRSAYSKSKYYSEIEVWRGISEGLNSVIVNPSVIIGPGDWNRSSGALFQTVKNGLKYYTPGSTGYVDVRDVAKAMIMLMNSDIVNEHYILNSENISFKNAFSALAQSIGATPPNKEVKRWMAGLAWRAECLKYLLTGRAPRLSKDAVNAGFGHSEYSNTKIKPALDFQFIPVNKAIQHAAKFFQKK